MKILIFGLPGSGKTYLAKRLQKQLECAWFNADEVRKMSNDWEFSNDARLRQAHRMRNLADFEVSHKRTVICDFICPLDSTRKIFNANYSIFMNTIPSGRFEDTNKIFESPSHSDLVISHYLSDDEIIEISHLLTEKMNHV